MALSTLVQRAVATTCRVGTLSLLGAQRHFSKEADDRPLTWVFLGPPVRVANGMGRGWRGEGLRLAWDAAAAA